MFKILSDTTEFRYLSQRKFKSWFAIIWETSPFPLNPTCNIHLLFYPNNIVPRFIDDDKFNEVFNGAAE